MWAPNPVAAERLSVLTAEMVQSVYRQYEGFRDVSVTALGPVLSGDNKLTRDGAWLVYPVRLDQPEQVTSEFRRRHLGHIGVELGPEYNNVLLVKDDVMCIWMTL